MSMSLDSTLDRRRFLALLGLAAGAPRTSEALELVDADRLITDNREDGVRILSAKGEFMGARGAYYGPPVPFGQLPKHLINALVASEDRRFYEHWGLDPRSMARAVWSTLTGRTQGGSTLTQQTIKEIYLKEHSPIVRKLLEEPVLAPILELNLSKEDILFVYLNRVFFGGNAYGIEAAARVYFNKYARHLSILESAMMVGLLPAPNRYNPHRNFEVSRDRGFRVIEQMVEANYLSRRTADRARQQNVTLAPSRSAWGGVYPRGTQIGWFARWAESEANANSAASARQGTRTITTTLDLKIQAIAERHLRQALHQHARARQIEEGAVVVMRYDGAVVALVGGRDYRQKEWDHATQAKRQPGSVAKLFVYLAALQEGSTPDTRVSDAPLTLGGRAVRNFDDKYLGEISLAAALEKSSNTAAVRLAMQNADEVRELVRILNVADDLEGEAGDLALGTYEARLVDLTAAFASVANHGRMVIPYSVQKVQDSAGTETLIRVRPESSQVRQVMAPQHAEAMRQMLSGVVQQGTGRAADPGFWAAGKTGTTSANRDAWFIGFTEEYVAGVWLGNSDNKPMLGVSGGGLPAQIWRAVMMEAVKSS
ncbi:PBP1A family penicillin-binding protein [Roseomonas sp. E05]|uniref:transglycosylase domain-containing protein n=1 Tax=Roseomonas sp. E05 TaxID=3046310 RepID=UPI0024BB1FFB|nr:PBP1A family penicillin-binding protein [Roseomonas sp. E05]MDJ0389550.1 PBP1A family penicillin-binding protein [Roseomonas sp. E05]